ncbi:MAG: prepilin-type N-terminal cleavage/methylation domain-containing protein [Planctomycetota bacterium]|nr:MAG: prepilin-type N-terminal cleavage/methylation domain-containing protein [Planctomycetota bacterium]
MSKKKPTFRQGFTLIELMLATVLAAIITLGLSIILADSQRGWHRMYNRIYSDVVTDSYSARRIFDHVLRRASGEKYFLGDYGEWIEVYYYGDATSVSVDRYARFFCDENNQLNVEYGSLNPTKTLAVQTICGNVSSCMFKATNRSAQMILTLDDETQSATVVSSSFMHN